MDAIRVKNLHCLTDTGTIPLKAINVLVGSNSSGKSSFLRIFPLLKQGLNTNKRGPILWLSEDVDFGDFKTSVKRGEKNIELQFKISEYIITVSITDSDTSDFINEIIIVVKDQTIKLEINNKGETECININDEKFCKDGLSIFESRFNILPVFSLKNDKNNLIAINHGKSGNNIILANEVEKYIKEILTGKISDSTIKRIRRKIDLGIQSKTDTLKTIQKESTLATWKNLVKDWDLDNGNFKSLNNRILLIHSLDILDEINEKLTKYFKGVNYIGPLRATAERYYRRQNLSLEEIDSRGANLPMFINDLSDSEKRDLKEWMNKYFGFYLLADYSSGHIAISLYYPTTSEKTNLADTGFGFSQIIPIIITLWTLIRQRRGRLRYRYGLSSTRYFVIEQPELHLHPAFQAKVADVFIDTIKLAKDNDIELKLIIETHSEAIINRIGHRISEQKILNDDVTVALFENKINNNGTNVTLSNFNDDGFLENWPIGFFNAD